MRRLALAVLITLTLAGPASAQSATQATTLPAPPPAKDAGPAEAGKDAANPAPGLRGSRTVLAPAKPVTGVPEAPGIRRRPADTALMSPNIAFPAAPRLTRELEAISGGGGQCRTKCAQELYFCQANEEGGGCDEVWRKCVLACPSQSGSLR